ncbi:MAG TPA: thiamine phosphate synthase [Planctomycetota bacterium]|nr:thiamine phosphate synthase [Planctomycetota bacterium]
MAPAIPPRRERLAAARLYLLATRRLSRLPLAEAVAAACRGGVRVVQVREKEAPDDVIEAIARDLAPAVREAGGLLIVNDRVEAALASGADGVHLGPEDATPEEARRRLGPDLLVGVTTHDLAQANRAVAAGADYVGIGPVFPTETKGVPIRVVGPEAAARVARAVPVPAFAIGGVAPGNARRLRAEGITRAAACAAILGAEDPEAAARAILAALGD